MLICGLIALTGLGGIAPAAMAGSVVYANTNLGAGGWWRNPSGTQLTTALNCNRMSIQESWPIRAIGCWNYYSTVFHGVSLPCGSPGYWYTMIFSGIKVPADKRHLQPRLRHGGHLRERQPGDRPWLLRLVLPRRGSR